MEASAIDIIRISVSFAASFIVSIILIPIIIRFSKKHNLVDNPNARKVHKEPIPTMGGVGIFLGFLISVFIWLFIYGDYRIVSVFAGLIILFIMGIFDDRLDLSAKFKFLIQTMVALIISYFGFRIESLNNLFGVNELPVWFQYAFSVFLVVGLTNAFNLIDGIDGLAGGLAFINSLILGIVLMFNHDLLFSIIALSFAGALLGFLRYNFNPAKIFMGDTGSLIIGFMMAVSGIVAIQGYDISNVSENKSGLTILVFGTLLIPVYDTIRVFSERVAKGSSPFKPDKTHVHHLLIETGSNHKKAAITLYLADIIIIVVAYLLRFSNPTISILILIGLTLLMSHGLYSIGLKWFMNKLQKVEKESEVLTDENRFLNRKDQDFNDL